MNMCPPKKEKNDVALKSQNEDESNFDSDSELDAKEIYRFFMKFKKFLNLRYEKSLQKSVE